MKDDDEDGLKVTTEAQLGLIGGTMGLLTGFSILSGVEIIYYILRLIIMNFSNYIFIATGWNHFLYPQVVHVSEGIQRKSTFSSQQKIGKSSYEERLTLKQFYVILMFIDCFIVCTAEIIW